MHQNLAIILLGNQVWQNSFALLVPTGDHFSTYKFWPTQRNLFRRRGKYTFMSNIIAEMHLFFLYLANTHTHTLSLSLFLSPSSEFKSKISDIDFFLAHNVFWTSCPPQRKPTAGKSLYSHFIQFLSGYCHTVNEE